MNKRFFSATAVIFIVWFIGGCLIHHWLLYDEYAKLSILFRPDTELEQLVPFSIFAHLVLAGAFTWIYVKGVGTDPWLGQGIRYGIVIACLLIVPTYTLNYVGQPLPGVMVVKQIAFDGIFVVVLGVIVAFVYRKQTR